MARPPLRSPAGGTTYQVYFKVPAGDGEPWKTAVAGDTRGFGAADLREPQ
ncbi:hypothetical protein [Solicola gregarius]|uniref:Uncharacterized protein n=1 Tax=Solicola gregarius TaxID=2908642 RepID=A0AA46TJ80_9ACTN|nr:hypothetical protein [Solicola gregarius]UYM06337.1 hypothetical protein L0C25_04465 [Solicola gregarius]